MEADILAWLVPIVLAIFGTVFLAVHVHLGTTLWIAVSYFVLALAFAFDIPEAPALPLVKAVAGDALYLLGLAALARGIALRYGRAPRDAGVLCYCALSVAAIGAVLGTTGSVSLELVASHVASFGLIAFAASRMRGRMRRPVDRAIFALLVLIAADLLGRALYFQFFTPADLVTGTWRGSAFAFALQLSSSLFGIAFAFTLLLAVGLDVIEALHRTSETDALTGVLNRRGFARHSHALRAEAGERAPAALMVVDIDHFKRVNDGFGHDAGDAVIAGLATLLRHFVGAGGCVGRQGGEEFAVLLVRADLAAARRVAEEARLAFRAIGWPDVLSETVLTASFGVVELTAAETLAAATARADKLLYLAKRAGRDRVVSNSVAAPGAADPLRLRPTDEPEPRALAG